MPRLESWRRNLQDLTTLSEILISTEDHAELYRQLTAQIAKITGAKSCLIAIYDKTTKRFITQRPHHGVIEKDGIPLEYEVTPEYQKLWNFRKQGVLVSNEAQEDPRLLAYFVRNYDVRNVIIAPMMIHQELLGIIAIMNSKRDFTDYDSFFTSIIAYQTGIILTNARLRSEERKRSEQIKLLNEMAGQINSSLVLDDILQMSVAAVQKALGMNELAIYMPAESNTILEMKACSGAFHKMIKEQGYIQSIEVGFLGYAFRNAKTIYSNNCKNDPLFLRHPMIATLSEACIPVKREGKVLAVLNVESPDTNAFSPSDLLTLETLADQLAIAFHNAETYAQERKHNEQMTLLSELISELAFLVDRTQIVKTTVGRIKQRFHYYFVALAWVNIEEQVIQDWYYLPRMENLSAESQRVPLTKGLTGKAVRTGKSVLVNNTALSAEYYNVLEEVRSELAVPVKIGDTVVGVLDLQSDQMDAFDESDMMIMEILAHALSTALQNADSYHRLERINSKLIQMSKMKDEIVQIVAHDFRSPLTVIRGYMDFLLKKGDWKDERQKEIMETVSLQAQRLQRLAEATLKASRLDGGEIAFSYEKVDLKNLLERLIMPWSEKHKFVINAASDLPLIKADPGRLQEVLENLLSNAIKYSPEGGTVEIQARTADKAELPEDLTSDPENTYIVVCVSDEGIGIPPEKRELLFQRFSRIHENRKIEGIGLGLYIAKKMIEMHGGRIWLKERSKGATFCFAVPALKEQAQKDNILIVDDDVHTLRLLGRSLSELGCDILTATDGREALDKVLRFYPKLVIIDVLMPVISGTELIERLKQNQATQSIPIVVFTGKSDFHLPEEYRSVPIISKNAGVGALKSAIEKILAGSALLIGMFLFF